jgi:hypothetical protein
VDPAIQATDGESFPIRAERQGVDPPRNRDERFHLRSRTPVPDGDTAGLAAGDQRLPIWAEGDGVDVGGVGRIEDVEELARRPVPEDERILRQDDTVLPHARCGEGPSVRAERQRDEAGRVLEAQFPDRRKACAIKQGDDTVLPRGGEHRAVWTEGNGPAVAAA